MNRYSLSFVALLALGAIATPALAHPEVPGPPQKQPVAIVNATIHPVSGPAIEKGTLVFEGGKITAIGKEATIPGNAEVIDVGGKHVYPGLFDALTDLGLVEINSVRATLDVQETGQVNPNVRAIVAVHPDSELIPVARSNGVLLALTAPSGRLMPGRSAVIQLDGWTWEDMAVLPDAGLHIEWPQPPRETRRRSPETPMQPSPPPEEAAERLRKILADARGYAAARAADPKFPRDARWESLQDVLAGKLPVVVHADEVRQMTAAVAFAQQEKLKLIIAGGYDAPQCESLLKQHDIPVIVGGVYRLPRRRGDDYDAAYSLPAKLHAAGIRFCISSQDRHGASSVRNLPYHAATAVAFGLSPDEALKAITLYPAQILGLADRVGSLEVGRHATLFVASGDPLDTPTQVEAAWIAGRKVELNDRHKRLYRKYEEKYKQLAPQ
ncbi:MAG: amidohydrolase family protein [Planctomycetaceae bacterium]|nr:amidohydrolase family protein [Planctomycetaceae bacterium]